MLSKTFLALTYGATMTQATPWVNGLNMPWDQCGNDWGVAYDSGKFKKYLQKYKNSNAGVLRQWIHFDANKEIKLFGNDGHWKSMPQRFWDDMKDNLGLMQQNNIKAIFTLFSFECMNNQSCYNIINNSDAQDAYIQNGLKPFLNALQNNKNQVYAIEMFNEPEWMVQGTGGNVQRTISLQKLQAFTKRCHDEINGAGFQSTVGGASLKWQCTKGKWCVGDWWGQTNQSFRTIHYYDWMAQGGNEFDPFSSSPSDWGLTGDVLIGESGSWNLQTVNHGTISVRKQFYWAHKNGWMGLMPWSDVTPGNTYYSIDDGLKCASNWNACQNGIEEDEELPITTLENSENETETVESFVQ